MILHESSPPPPPPPTLFELPDELPPEPLMSFWPPVDWLRPLPQHSEGLEDGPTPRALVSSLSSFETETVCLCLSTESLKSLAGGRTRPFVSLRLQKSNE